MELRIREYKPHKTKKEGYVDSIPKRSILYDIHNESATNNG